MAIGIVAALTATACGGGSSHPAATGLAATGPTTYVSASSDQCGQGWTKAHPGQQTFVVKDVDIVAGEVYLIDARTRQVYAYLEPVAPDATANLSVDLGSGSYAFECAMSDHDPVSGPTVTVPGSVPQPAPPVSPVSEEDLIGPTKQYEAYVAGRLPVLATQVAALRADIDRNDLATARTDWLTAHLTYETLGAAYGAFGNADGAINGTTAGLPGGLTDANFTGFHRIEYGLWHGQAAATLRPYVDRLVSDVGALVTAFPSAQIDPLQLSVRAHEITENALQFELTGQTDYGSHSNLATVSANLQGTVVTLDLLKPILTPRFAGLAQLEAAITQDRSDVAATDVHGRWTPLDDLTTRQRELIDSDISELAELLAPVASICEPRRTS